MLMISGLWGLAGAFVVAWILKRNEEQTIAAIERGEEIELRRSMAPATGFFVCALALIAAPLVLGKARGLRGVLEGVVVVAGVPVMSVATVVGLALVQWALIRAGWW